MAGYMTKLMGYGYEGDIPAASDLKNGQFVSIVGQEATALTAASDLLIKVTELEGPYGMPGLRCTVEGPGNDAIYLVENIPNKMIEDEREAGPKEGEDARIHRLLAGEEFLVSGDLIDPTAFVVGDIFYAGKNIPEVEEEPDPEPGP